MECIDFDKRFEQFATQWMRENSARFHGNPAAMEAQMPDVYVRWLNHPAKWLGGATPGAYFAGFCDAQMLADWMCSYFQQKISVPDQLLEQLVSLGDAAVSPLMRVLESDSAPFEARLTTISLLREMAVTLPLALYVDWVRHKTAQDELADMAAESLVAMGPSVVVPVLEAAESATPPGQEAFLDVLCNFPGDARIYDLAVRLFRAHPDRRALFASYLGKLGDARAIALLNEAAQDEDINYLDFIELRNAIEALGGEAPMERDFAGDMYYESLRTMG